MGDHRLPKRVMSGELENAGKRGPGGKEKEWTDYVADDLRLFGVTGDWRTAALDPGAWYKTVGVNDSITVSSAWELTSVSMHYSQGNGVHTPLSRLVLYPRSVCDYQCLSVLVSVCIYKWSKDIGTAMCCIGRE